MAVYSVNLSILERVFKETFTEEVKSQHFVAAVVTYNSQQLDKNGELTVKARQLQRGKKWREDEDKADGEDCDNDGEFSAFRSYLLLEL